MERSFRINKHTIKIRAIFHRYNARIRAYIAFSYIAFACLQCVEYRLKLKDVNLSPQRIHLGLENLSDVVFWDRSTQLRFAIAAQPMADSAAIERALQIKRKRTPRLIG